MISLTEVSSSSVVDDYSTQRASHHQLGVLSILLLASCILPATSSSVSTLLLLVLFGCYQRSCEAVATYRLIWRYPDVSFQAEVVLDSPSVREISRFDFFHGTGQVLWVLPSAITTPNEVVQYAFSNHSSSSGSHHEGCDLKVFVGTVATMQAS
jgi:hypothetical protein